MVHRLAFFCLAGLLAACSSNSDGSGGDPLACERTAAESLATCVQQMNDALRACYLGSGSACASGDAAVAAAVDTLARDVRAECRGDATVQTVGYGPLLTTATLVDRLTVACQSETASIASRTFGGPHGAALAAADAGARTCLEAAHREAAFFVNASMAAQTTCIADEREGSGCDAAATSAAVGRLQSDSTTRVGNACPNLGDLIALDADTYVNRAAAQSRCLTATVHPDPAPLALDCGPRGTIVAPPRGEYVEVVLDSATTRCGDGSPYAFSIRLAPEGAPLENVLIGMEGGGVCVFEDDCAGRPAELFEAMNDTPPAVGIFSNDPAVSPFADWTKVYLPYCNQDVFIGGGTTSNFPRITVHRFGAVNVRVALRYVRDILWQALDASSTEGYRPDHIRALFGGFSAGAFGTLYNYHWVLDDLQWAHTSAYPDAGLALDSGEAISVGNLGLLLISDAPPLGWGSRRYLPPYCFNTRCGVGPEILFTSAPRLKGVPEQQFLVLSNQVDRTQQGTTFFGTLPGWINALRESYCDTGELNGVRYFMPAIVDNVHVISPREEIYTSRAVDGVTLRDWLAGAVSDPDAVTNRVEEGTLVDAYPGVEPFPCPVAP